MEMKKLMSVIFVFLLSACATTQHVFLTDIEKPSNEDLAVMKTQLTILQNATAEGEMIKPFIFQTMGVIEETTPEGVTTYKHLTREERLAAMTLEERQLYDTFLLQYEKESEERKFIPSREFSFDSARSVKENSIVEIGGWHIIYGKKRQVFRFDIKITNTTQNTLLTPDDIIIVDADKKSSRILSSDEYVYYAEGMTSQEALSQSSVMSIYASQLQKTYGYSGTMYSYGTTYGNYYSGFSTFRAYPIQDPYSSFASGFAQGWALGAAIQAAQIDRMVRECRLIALKPASTLSQGSNVGRIWSLAGKLPIEIHIFTLGDHHIIKLDQIQERSNHQQPK